jgi:stage III sporulation protein AG
MVLLGGIGMLLILFSQSLGGGSEQVTPESGGDGTGTLYTAEEYIAKTEEKLCALITQIEGVGRAEVMVTLENNGEYVYAQEEKRNLDKNVEPGGEGGDKITSK